VRPSFAIREARSAYCSSATPQAGSGRLAGGTRAIAAPYPPSELLSGLPMDAPTDIEYDAVIIGSGVGGLATAAQLVKRGAKVVVLEKCVACVQRLSLLGKSNGGQGGVLTKQYSKNIV
jgi:NADPH-dependent 2,4-dienoyl-CoA reductase/sulfur reductase-like enzyme